MIDQTSHDRLGWARFSDDMTKRYRLRRILVPRLVEPSTWTDPLLARVVFVMLNPSTADAFKNDPTVARCCEFARRWGADVLDVVNLFALRSTDPAALLTAKDRGDDIDNDRSIYVACAGARHVIAAWGNDGNLFGRAQYIRSQLQLRQIRVMHLGTTGSGNPLHPIARGKHFIPYDREPVEWST